MTLTEILRLLVTDPSYLFWLPNFQHTIAQFAFEAGKVLWGGVMAILLFKLIGLIK